MISVEYLQKNKGNVEITGKWKDVYFFNSCWGKEHKKMIMRDKAGTVIAKFDKDWLIRPFTPRDKTAAKEILEFIRQNYDVGE